jgi:hypothetical protein
MVKDLTMKKIKFSNLFIPLLGFGALLWFLIRVIPKPSRATYPCMRAAYPIASGFILYVISLSGSVFAFGKAKKHFKDSRYWAMSIFIVAAVIMGFFTFQTDRPVVYANSFSIDTANVPVGVGQGIFPGRVVWSWNPNSTNENCLNNAFGEAYYLSKNTDMGVVSTMMTNSIQTLTGQTTVQDAWNALFVYFNQKKGKGSIGYQSGEKIFIKTNGVGSTVVSSTNHNITDLNNYIMARTSPQPVLALLRQLINVCGIPQANISVGDPQRDVQNEFWNIWHSEFPNVKYICYKGGESRTKSVAGTDTSIYYSDRGALLRAGSSDWTDMSAGISITGDKLYTVLEQADYMIIVAALKVHERGGMTLLAKCNFGSQTRSDSKHLHMGLVNPDGVAGGDANSRFGYHKYRILVDLLGHKKIGGNTMLFVVDGLWGGAGANLPPVKFQTVPFNNDWPSSLFISQDPVALESVCYDLLKSEFTSDKHTETYPQMEGVDDHLHQAADSLNWPTGIRYDPERDGTVLASLGVHEHWNNSDAKQYTRDLGTGTGIELLKLMDATAVQNIPSNQHPSAFLLSNNYPNPFNPSTHLRYYLPQDAQIELSIFNIQGKCIQTLVQSHQSAGQYEVTWDSHTQREEIASGVYFARLRAEGNHQVNVQVQRMLLLK